MSRPKIEILKNFKESYFFYLGQGVGERAQPGDGGGGYKLLHEHAALVLVPEMRVLKELTNEKGVLEYQFIRCFRNVASASTLG